MTASLYTEVETKLLSPDPDQPRNRFDEAALAALTENIRHRGILQPLLIREGQKKGRYIIVDGERRWRAAKAAKLRSVPALVVTAGETAQLRMDQVAANQLRENLSTMDLARTLVGLREKQRMSDNDIAAYLDKQGIPALTSAEMADLMALTRLPEWAQKWVDSGEMDLPAATVIAQVPEADSELLPALQESLADGLDWTAKLTRQDVERQLADVYQTAGTDLTKTQSFWGRNAKDVVLFNPTKACRGCEHKRSFGSSRICMNRPCFDEKQAQAKEAGLLPGGKKPKPEDAPRGPGPAETAEIERQKNLSRSAKRAEYLDRWLRAHLKQGIPVALKDALFFYRAAGMPNGARYGRVHRLSEKTAAPRIRFALKDFLGVDPTAAEIDRIAAYVIDQLEPYQVLWLVRDQCHVDFKLAYQLDDEYLRLLSKAELQELAFGIIEDANKLTAKVLREKLLDPSVKLRAPKELVELYETPIEAMGDDCDQGPACIGCDCTELDPCPEGCSWLRRDDFSGVCSNCPDEVEKWDRERADQEAAA